MSLQLHQMTTGDGKLLGCVCSTGVDHDEAHFDGATPEGTGSEALAMTSNVEIEAPTTLRELRDLVLDALNNYTEDDERRITNASPIEDEDGVLGVEFADTLYFIEIKEADA